MLKVVNWDKIKQDYRIWKESPNSTIYISGNSVVKILCNDALNFFDISGYSLEKRLEASERFSDITDKSTGITEIPGPRLMVEKDGRISGFEQFTIVGPTSDEFFHGNHSFKEKAQVQQKIDRVVIEAHKRGAIFPDLCNPGNIIINHNTPIFLDHDGIQIDGMPAFNYANEFDPTDHLEKLGGYDRETKLFTKKADSVGAAMLASKLIFNTSLLPVLNGHIGLDCFFNMINLESKKTREKFEKIFSPGNEDEYLGDNLRGLSDQFELIGQDCSHIQLTRK